MPTTTNNLLACPECDALQRQPHLGPGAAASCVRCGCELVRNKPDSLEHTLAFMVGAAVAFAAIFFSEWGDVGQVTAAGMAAKFVWSARESTTRAALWQTALLVWIGAVAAMITKGALASLLGAGVRRWIANRIQPRTVRLAATCALVVLGVLAVLETLGVLAD